MSKADREDIIDATEVIPIETSETDFDQEVARNLEFAQRMGRKQQARKILSISFWLLSMSATFMIGQLLVSRKTAPPVLVYITTTPLPPVVVYITSTPVAYDPYDSIGTVLKIECWGADKTDGQIGGWISSYPYCVLNDGGGDKNALYEGEWYYKPRTNEICVQMKNLRSDSAPSNTLAVGFRITLKQGTFYDGTGMKELQTGLFTGDPLTKNSEKCVRLAQ